MRPEPALATDLLTNAETAYEAGRVLESVAIFEELGRIGVPRACQFLSMIYQQGDDGVGIDEGRSAYWASQFILLLSEAAEAGDVNALYELARAHEYGDSIAKDWATAMGLYRKAARSGSAEAMNRLATIYEFGWCGEKKDAGALLDWLYKAVSLKHPEAMYRLARLLLDANPSESEKALELLRESAAQGFWPANEWLASYKK